MTKTLTLADRAALHGFAFSANEKELVEALRQRRMEIKDKPGFTITSRYDPSDYNCTTYRGTATADFSDGDIAMLCDGNTCFGARVERQGEKFICKINID